ncbi:MAG: hypothetical protein HYV27_17800 [Candidatus Hydrogenedentes bacterium]|nr:hypothetical protein [Candidatus Hydrogenedentota bacterium]
MSSFSIQFHASSSELLRFATEVAQEFKLYTVASRFPPHEVIALEPLEIATVCGEDQPFGRIMFTMEKPVLPASDSYDFVMKNQSCLILVVGKIRKGGLEESWFTTKTDDLVAFKLWSKLARRLKKMTVCGITVVNRETGIRGFSKSHRYTQGAKDLEQGGVEMWPLQGPKGPIILLGNQVD